MQAGATETATTPWRTFAWLGVFAAAMGVLEAIVVVYLRELYYPTGFRFPLQPIPPKILLTEIAREICTIVMLASVAAAVARNAYRRLSYFLFTFGLWDIFYYVALKAFLNWPSSLLTWDILFLIPITWAGPVLAPLIVSITMIGMGILIVHLQSRYGAVKAGALVWVFLGLGSGIIVLTFVWDYARLIVFGGFLPSILGLAESQAFQKAVAFYVPAGYNWLLFAFGEGLVISGIILLYRRSKGRRSDSAW